MICATRNKTEIDEEEHRIVGFTRKKEHGSVFHPTMMTSEATQNYRSPKTLVRAYLSSKFPPMIAY
jgi:hypothetical protein